MANISLWNPAEELSDMRRLVNRLMGEPFGAFERPAAFRFTPSVEIEDLGKEFLVTCELPGMTEKEVEVTVTGNTLKIRGEKRSERESDEAAKKKAAQGEERTRPMFSERAYGMFERVITLPDEVDAQKVDASFRNGVLQIRLPRRQESMPRQIPVKIH